jgi:Cys-rich repeat protein
MNWQRERANVARLVSSCLLLALAGCASGNKAPVTFARPSPQGSTVDALSTGYAGTASFDAPVVDVNSWTGSPVGTGTFSLQSNPAVAGGPQAIGAVDGTTQYVVIADFAAPPGAFFAVLSEGPMAVGTHAVDNVVWFAGLFDGNSGQPLALATQGTVTLTAAGGLGAQLTGSFSGTLDDVVSTTPTACSSSAQCASGEVCVGGVCQAAPPGCTSNAQCPSGQSCQAGRCVGGPSGSCDGAQGAGAYSGNTASAGVCSAFGSGAVSVANAAAIIADDGSGSLGLYVVDPARDTAGVILPLAACPSATGPVQVSGATFWDQVNSGGATFYAQWAAQSASVDYTQLTPSLKGTFTVSLPSGGQVSGSFDVQ